MLRMFSSNWSIAIIMFVGSVLGALISSVYQNPYFTLAFLTLMFISGYTATRLHRVYH